MFTTWIFTTEILKTWVPPHSPIMMCNERQAVIFTGDC